MIEWMSEGRKEGGGEAWAPLNFWLTNAFCFVDGQIPPGMKKTNLKCGFFKRLIYYEIKLMIFTIFLMANWGPENCSEANFKAFFDVKIKNLNGTNKSLNSKASSYRAVPIQDPGTCNVSLRKCRGTRDENSVNHYAFFGIFGIFVEIRFLLSLSSPSGPLLKSHVYMSLEPGLEFRETKFGIKIPTSKMFQKSLKPSNLADKCSVWKKNKHARESFYEEIWLISSCNKTALKWKPFDS